MSSRDARGNHPGAVVVCPPLPLSPAFIDYPYLTSAASCQGASILRTAGLRVRVCDGLAQAESGLRRVGDHLWLGEPRESFLARLQFPDAACVVTILSPYLLTGWGRDWLGEVVATIRGRFGGTLVLAEMFLGGTHYIEYDPHPLLDLLPGVDLLLRYEGEALLARLAASLMEEAEIPRGVWAATTPQPLGDMPPPAWDLVDRDSYFMFLRSVLSSPLRRTPFPADPARTLPVITARGCPFGCVFCTKNPGLAAHRDSYRPISFSALARWVRGWAEDFNLQRLIVLDEAVNVSRSRFEALLSLLEQLDLRVELPNGVRADLVHEEHIQRLAPRTSSLTVSLESASLRVQDEILKKRLDPRSVERVAKWCAQYGLPLNIHGMIGIPGETRKEIVQTLRELEMLHRKHGATPLLQLAVPLPGTELDAICSQPGISREPSQDVYSAFQGRGELTTPEFDPEYLALCSEALALAVATDHPRKLIVNLTYRCNNHCVFCAVGDRPPNDALLSRTVATLRYYREQGYELLDLDGGEPTLHPDLTAIIRAARRLGFARVTLITNGRSLAYRTVAKRLVDAGVDEVLVSLHAPEPELQARLSGSPESFGQTIQGLKRILRLLGPDRVGVNTTVVRENLATLRALGDLLGVLGVRRWALQLVTPFGRATSGQVPDPATLRGELQRLLDHPPAGITIHLVNCPPCLLPGYERLACADFDKERRDMVFVGASGENLQHFLNGHRQHDDRCFACPWIVLCAGHYCFDPPLEGS